MKKLFLFSIGLILTLLTINQQINIIDIDLKFLHFWIDKIKTNLDYYINSLLLVNIKNEETLNY